MAVKNNIKLIFSYFALNVKKEWKYKASFFMQLIMMILNDAFFIIQWYIIFKIAGNIGGYGFRETMLLWAISSAGFGFSHAFFYGAYNIKDMVYEGRLDVFLTQPKNVLINVCCSSTSVSAIGDMIYAFIVLIFIKAPFVWFLYMVPIMVLSGLLYVSVYVIYVSFAFYIKRGDAVAQAVEGTILKAANYPPVIFNSVVKWIFLTIIPVFFYTVVPAEFLFMSFNGWWILGYAGFVALVVALAFLSFNRGLKKYNSGSLMGGRL